MIRSINKHISEFNQIASKLRDKKRAEQKISCIAIMINKDSESPFRIFYSFNSLSDIYFNKSDISNNPFELTEIDETIKNKVHENTFINHTNDAYRKLLSEDFFNDNIWIHTQNEQFYMDEHSNELSLLNCCSRLKADVNLEYNKNNRYQSLFSCSERKFLNDKFLINYSKYCIYTTLPTCGLCFDSIKHIMKKKHIEFFSSDLQHSTEESFTHKSKSTYKYYEVEELKKKLKNDLV